MSLTLKVLPRPLYGDEEEFEELWVKINVARGLIEPDKGARHTFWQRLFGTEGQDRSLQGLYARFNEISMTAADELEAPVVGRDRAANDWARSRLELDGLEGKDLEDALRDVSGYSVLALLPPSDGLPLYSAADLTTGADESSFCGDFLALAEDLLGTDLVMRAETPMLAPAADTYGQTLMGMAQEFAQQRGLENVIGNRFFPVLGDESAASQAHIVDQAGRWYRYWAGKGHGVDPIF